MTTVVQTTYPQAGGYPQPGYQHPQPGYQHPQPQPIVYQAAPPPTVITTNANPSISDRYNKRAGFITGIMQLLAAGTLVLLGIVLMVLGTWFRSAWNIWGGICFYGVSGILGVVSKNQSRCVIIAYMVMSIISAVCAGGQMIYDSNAANVMSWAYCDDYYYYYTALSCENQEAIVALHALAGVVGFGEMVIAIVASSICCCGCCGNSTPGQQTTVVTYAQPGNQGQINVVAGGSYSTPGTYPPPVAYPNAGSQQPPGQYMTDGKQQGEPPAYPQGTAPQT